MKIKAELEKRKLPELLRFNSGKLLMSSDEWKDRRNEIKEILLDNLWGRKPDWHENVTGYILDSEYTPEKKGISSRIRLDVMTDSGEFSFEFDLIKPINRTNVPVFVHIAFAPEDNNDDDVTEYLMEKGYALAKVFYRDIVNDLQPDKENGVGGLPQRFDSNSWGKVHMWAWSASRIVDYLETLNDIDKSRIAVIGHSRLGKAALCAGALDERFSLTISNCSGAGGIAILRGKEGELIKNLCGKGSKTWLCPNFTEYAYRENELPYDHHFAAALCAPRNLYVASATNDPWADPPSEFLSAVAASKVYELLGKSGLIAKEEWEAVQTVYHQGTIGYHLREGNHYLGKYDWEQFVKYRNKHNC